MVSSIASRSRVPISWITGGLGSCAYGTGKNGDWKIVVTHSGSFEAKAGARGAFGWPQHGGEEATGGAWAGPVSRAGDPD